MSGRKSSLFDLSGRRRALLQAMLEERGVASPASERISRGTDEGPAPLSASQRALWLLQRLDPASAAYNVAAVVHLRGRLRPRLLEGALTALTERHEPLRTTIRLRGDEPVQEVGPAEPVALPLVDLTAAGDRARDLVTRWAAANAGRAFDLASEPPLRTLLLRLAGERHALVVILHHVACDGASQALLFRELAALYEALETGSPHGLPELPIRYRDFSRWEEARWADGSFGGQLEYWTGRLATPAPPIQLPVDRSRPPVKSHRGGILPVRLPATLGTDLERLGRSADATLFMVLMAAFQALLGRYAGESDIATGTPVANRTRAETRHLIGYFVNTLVLRTDLSGDPPFMDLLERVRSVTRGAFAHQDLPFERLVEALHPDRVPSAQPLFQVMLALQGVPGPVPGMGGLEVTVEEVFTRTSKLDLLLSLSSGAKGLEGYLEYDVDLFDEATARRLLGHWRSLLEAAVKDRAVRLSRLPLLEAGERQQLLVEWQGLPPGTPGALPSIPELFLEAAARTPDAVALCFGDDAVSYDCLARRAAALARRLEEMGVGPDRSVAVFLERSPSMVVALLATLLSGGAYVPLDPQYPRERSRFILEETAAPVVLTERCLVAGLGQPEEGSRRLLLDEVIAENPAVLRPRIEGESLAYVIYTSGSTGRPKGVAIRHRSAAALAAWARAEYSSEELATVAASTSICFDLSVFELFAPLTTGGRVLLVRDALDLADVRTPVSLVNTVPSAAAELVRLGTLPPGTRVVNLAGEPLPPDLVDRLLGAGRTVAAGGVERVLNLYGPSEDTTYSTLFRARRGDARVAIGRPLPGTDAYVLDRELGPSPIGAAGELCLAGTGLARGYLARPSATAERFVPDPRSALRDRPGARLYRTGDLARVLPDGALDFLGRLDHQVKLRGYRIELGEIEAALLRHGGVREAAAMVLERPAGPELAAFVVAPRDSGPRSSELREHLGRVLPAYMTPARLEYLERLPRTPNGKIDRRKLAATLRPEEGPEAAHAPPGDAVEEILCRRWEELLGRSSVGTEDDFFRLGGSSLMAVRLVSRLRRDLGVDLPVRAVFETPTVTGLARRVEALRTGRREAPEPIPPADRSEPLPLSYSQERIWFFEQLAAGTPAYNLPGAVELRGRVDAGVLQASVAEVVRRHEALRTRFRAVGGRPVQQVAPPVVLALPRVDLGGLAPDRQAICSRRLLAAEARRPFDLERPPLLRTLLIDLAGEHSLLALTVHHIAADGWSIDLLVRELASLYTEFSRGRPSPLPEPTLQYGDFAVWQRSEPARQRFAGELAYWLGQLAGQLPVLELPADRPRGAVQGFRGATLASAPSPALAEAVDRLAGREGATRFMVLLAGFTAFLHRLTGETDVLVGTAVANRRRLDVEGQIGCHINTLVLRTGLGDTPSMRALVRRTRSIALSAYEHQEMPFEALVEELRPARDAGHSPLFQILFLYEAERRGLQLPGLDLVPVRGTDAGAARFELTLTVREERAGLATSFNYASDVFDASTVRRWAEHWRTFLGTLLADPDLAVDRARFFSQAQRHQVLREWSDALHPDREEGAGDTIDGRIRRQARRRPDAVAVVGDDEVLSFGELARRARRLAARLRARGVGPESLVGIHLDRSPRLLVALLAVLEAGGAYVPLDPAYPRERIRLLLQESGLDLLLTEPSQRWRLPGDGVPVLLLDDQGSRGGFAAEGATNDEPPRGLRSGALAYVIHTSGSTGRPKGVMIEHGSVLNLFRGMDEALGSPPGRGMVATTSVSFDISVLELFWTLARGEPVLLVAAPASLSAVSAPSPPPAPRAGRGLEVSLFYFASDEGTGGGGSADTYRLLLEGARFADRAGFSAVWIPERHFHAFGGIYPNPSVAGAALAAATRRIAIRAGSVVLPLHHPVRVAEEWAMVDNLSGGRVGISFASGWHADDFVLAPESYRRRRQVMRDGIGTVRRLWRGEGVRLTGGLGQEVEVVLRPRPVQPELPFWVTAAGSPETFRLAGELGANLLTHLLFQDVDQLEEKVRVYREAWTEHGHGPTGGHVTVMLHTFVGQEQEHVRATVREPLCRYLRNSLDLMANLARAQGLEVDPTDLGDEGVEAYLELAFDRYFDRHGLLGTPESCLGTVERLQAAGVDELGCLIDFGVEVDTVLESLEGLAELRRLCDRRRRRGRDRSLPALLFEHRPARLQGTPSLLGLLASDRRGERSLGAAGQVLVGGETLPPDLAGRLIEATGGEVFNVYGPTETTVWSTTRRLDSRTGPAPIGRPIANTDVRVVNPVLEAVPVGVVGELLLGGAGVARGYLRRPGLTAERFLPDPVATSPGNRVYRTGDLVRWSREGELRFLGRNDHQVKLRGHRVEPGEIESVLARHPAVDDAVVQVREDAPGDRRLVAYYVPVRGAGGGGLLPLVPREDRLRALRERRAGFRLPNDMTIAHLSDLQANLLYREIYTDNRYFRGEIALEDGATVFDVGANIGMFTLQVHQLCREPRVHCFEPIPPTFQVLRENVELYGLPATLHPYGLSDSSGTAELTFYPRMAGLSGRYSDPVVDRSLTRAIVLQAAGGGGTGVLGVEGAELEAFLDEQFEREVHRCELRTLSDVLRDTGVERIDLLKVDVERAELDVLRGIEEGDWPKIEQLVLEVDTRENLERVQELLAAHGLRTTVEELVAVPPVDGGPAVEVFMVFAARERRPARQPSRPSGHQAVESRELRRYLAERMPEVMVPASFVRMDRFPLTPNGKVDRRALAALPEPTGVAAAADYVPPKSETERLLTEVWAEVLHVPRVGVHDNFFEIGGNSLLAVELRSRLEATMGREVPVVELFRRPTISALASHFAGDAETPGERVERAQGRGERMGESVQAAAAAASRQAAARRRSRRRREEADS